MEKKFGNFTVNKWGMDYYVGYCSLEEEDIKNLEKALKYLKKVRKTKSKGRKR